MSEQPTRWSKILDPHIHMYSRTVQDYMAMREAGVSIIVEPSFWLGGERRHVGTFLDFFDHILTFEHTRAAQHGIRHYAAIGMNPKEAGHLKLGHDVIDAYLEAGLLDHTHCVAIGEIGFNLITPAEEEIFIRQLRLAEERRMPVLVHTPHHVKKDGVVRIIEIVVQEGVDQERICIDHNEEDTIGLVLEQTRCWAGMTVYPVSKLTPDRAARIVKQWGTERVLVNSSADWGLSDPQSVPNTVAQMRGMGFTEEEIRRVVWDNPLGFFKASPSFLG